MWVVLAIGSVAALSTLVWGRRRSVEAERRLYAVILVAMQAIYVGYVIVQPSIRAFALEGLLLLMCWGFAAGWRRLAFLLPVGYLLHGLWDLRHGLQLTNYVPTGYPEMCAAYDWILTLYFLTRLRVWSR